MLFVTKPRKCHVTVVLIAFSVKMKILIIDKIMIYTNSYLYSIIRQNNCYLFCYCVILIQACAGWWYDFSSLSGSHVPTWISVFQPMFLLACVQPIISEQPLSFQSELESSPYINLCYSYVPCYKWKRQCGCVFSHFVMCKTLCVRLGWCSWSTVWLQNKLVSYEHKQPDKQQLYFLF